MNNKKEIIDAINLFAKKGYEIYFKLINNDKQIFMEAHSLRNWILEEFNFYIGTDISPRSGLYEWFIHDTKINVDDINKELNVKLIAESEDYDYTTELEALTKAFECAYDKLNN